MISRRNIRIKVMQTLYSIETQENLISSADAVKLLDRQFDQSRQLVAYLLYFLTEVARYAETDAVNRASKHLPTQKDLEVNTKISGNEVLRKILEHPAYIQMLKRDKPHLFNDPEQVRRAYLLLAASEEYLAYIATPGRDKKAEKEILEYLLTACVVENEGLTGHVEEKFTNWDDDAEMAYQLVMGFIARPASLNFDDMLGPEKYQFARDLLVTTIEKKDAALDLIKPKLKNWDADRIAVLDMLLMRMGVCEFLFFETIPPKVTINEYIDLAKEYSTQQSGQFINGILDNIHKDLVKDDLMHKVSFRPS